MLTNEGVRLMDDPLTCIYVDADASPVKEEVLRVARRYGVKVYFVCNRRMRMGEEPLAEIIVVANDPDAADDWIAERITASDVAVSADVPLAARCVKKGARVLDPRGRVFTEESIGEALANRDIMTFLRENGTMISETPPYLKKDRSRFLQRLDEIIQALRRAKD